MNTNTISLYGAIKKLRECKENNLPVKLVYYTYNEKDKATERLKTVNKATIRSSFTAEQSEKADMLINYIDNEAVGNQNRSFNLPLLVAVNDIKVTA
jgi:hypothetical protein